MIPNLSRVSADGIPLAIQLLESLPDKIDPITAGALTDEERYALGAYSVRTPTIALRAGDITLVQPALLALCLSTGEYADDRDVMIQLALHHVVAQRLGLSSAAVFAQVADRLPSGWLADLLREFGNRHDVTLQAFGWRELTTPQGPDFGSIMVG